MTRATEIIADNPLAYWTNDSTSGTAMSDVSGNFHNGFYVGTPVFGQPTVPPGRPGSAVKFDGTRADVAYGAWMPSGAFTFEMWFRPVSVVDNRALAARHGGPGCTFDIIYGTAGRLQFRIGTGVGNFSDPVKTISPLVPDEDVHIVCTYDAVNIKIYKNAVLQQSLNVGSTLVATNVALSIAALSEGFAGSGWYSQIVADDIAYYGTALSQARISAHFDPPSTPNPPTNLRGTGSTETSVTAAWDAPAVGAVDYYEVRVNGGAPFSVGSSLSYLFSGLTSGLGYNIEVRSVRSGLFSAWVGPVRLYTQVPEPPEPPVSSDSCYAMVRGSAVRVTELDARGRVGDPVRYAVSTAVATVTVNEVLDSGSDETIRSPERARRVRFRRPDKVLGYTVDVKFLRVDPGLYSLISGVPLVRNAAGDVIGFDADARERVTTFGLEVWSRLSANRCADGAQKYGYTLFPSLSGGRIAGFAFTNGAVSFTLVGARSSKRVGWGIGPYDLEGKWRRMLTRVSGNNPFRTYILSTVPPTQQDGIQTLAADVVDNGTASNPMPDPTAPEVLDGGRADTSPWIVDGGRA